MAGHDRDALRPQQLSLLAFVIGDEPAAHVQHPMPGHVAGAARHRPTGRPGASRRSRQLGQPPVAGGPARWHRPHQRIDGVLERCRLGDHHEAGRKLHRANVHFRRMRVLLIAFYFPPAGGGGVQRALKFCRYLPEFGVDVDVLAPEDPKWLAVDRPLLEEIPETTVVHRVPFHGPRAAYRGEALRGTSGLLRLAVEARFLWPRLLVPDKAVPWFLNAVPAATRIVRSRGIDAIVTTSPPNSLHLIGAAVAARTGVPWVADFRDPWLENIHRLNDNAGLRLKAAANRRMAQVVAGRATRLVAVTDAIADELAGMHPSARAKTAVIENGSDFADFQSLAYRPGERFTIVHAGSFFGERSPRPTLLAVRALLDRRPELRGRMVVRFVGDMRGADREWAGSLGIDDAWEETGFRPYGEALAAERAADALLLLIEHAGGRGDSVPCGKLWEYFAAGRPILAAVPTHGVAAELIQRYSAGEVRDSDDADGLSEALETMIDRRDDGGLPDIVYPEEVRERLSRRTKSKELAAVLQEIDV
jgi:glycosyltransferase involved in cell wall biosynthesis